MTHSRKHVCCFVTYYAPYISGLTLYAVRLAESLAARGYVVHVISMRYRDSLPQRQMDHGVLVERVPFFMSVSKGFISFVWIFQSIIAVWKADSVVIHIPQPEGWWPAFLGRIMRKNVVVVYHCDVTLPKSFFSRVLQIGIDWCHTLAIVLSHRVVVYTHEYQKASRLAGVLTKAHVIFPPVIIHKPSQRVAMRMFGKRKKEIRIGIAARVAAEKGIDVAIEALRRFRLRPRCSQAVLYIAGPLDAVGEAPYVKKIRKLVSQDPTHVRLLGDVAPSDMGSFYSGLTALLVPSLNSTEAFGMVQVEAMAAGVPVIASDLPGVSVPVSYSSMGIIIPPGDVRALEEAMYRLYTHASAYTRQKYDIVEQCSVSKFTDSFTQII